MLNEATRFTGLPDVKYGQQDVQLRTILNASWARAPLPSQKRLYDISIKFIDLSCARASKDLSNSKCIAEEVRLTAHAYADFCIHVARFYNEFRSEDHNEAKANLHAMITPVDVHNLAYAGKSDQELRAMKAFRKIIYEKMLEANPDATQNFFAIIHKYDLADIFAQQIASHNFPMQMGMAYRQWMKRNPQECASKSLAFAAANKGTKPVSDVDAVKQSEAMLVIHQRRAASLVLKDQSTTRVQKEIHTRILDILDYCENVILKPFPARMRDKVFTDMAYKYSRVYILASKNYHDFTPDDRGQIEKALSIMLTISQPSNLQLMRMTIEDYTARYLTEQKEIFSCFSKESYPDFFRAVYQYGFEQQFKERLSASAIPVKMKSAYEFWAAENRNWIDHKEWLIPPVVRTQPVAPVSPPAVFKNVARIPAPLPVVNALPKAEIAKTDKSVQPSLPPSLLKKLKREERMKGWDLSTPSVSSPALMVKPVTVFEPEEIDWEELERLTQPETPPAATVAEGEPPVVAIESEPETHSLLDVVRGYRNLVVCDDDVHEQSRSRKRAGAKSLSGVDEHFPHDRRGLLTKALLSDPVEGKYMTAYCDDIDPNADVKRYPYDVIDIEFPASTDGHVEHAQIFVCNFHGFSTFIRREAKSFDPADETHISALRNDPKVWMVSFLNDDQWIRDVQERLYTPVADMTVQLKHSHMWADRAAALEETFVEYVVRHGRIPDAQDTRVIDFGPLAGQATWAAGKAALNRHTVGGLENVRTYKGLLAHLCEKYPELSGFVKEKPVRVCAVALRQSLLVSEDVSCVAGWEKGALNLAFQYGAVEGLDAVMPPGRSVPRRFEEFAALCRIQP